MAKENFTTPKAKAASEKVSPDLTNSCAVTFYAAIWLIVAALVTHIFVRY